MSGRYDEWADLMRLANAGDAAAYERLLTAMAPVLRSVARRGLSRASRSPDEAEDIVQEILLAVHLKRHTWDERAPLAPWVFAIARNKLIDALRRKGRRIHVNIDDFAEILPGEEPEEQLPAIDLQRHIVDLPQRQREVLSAIAVESASIREAAQRLKMSEGAVRVALHRGLSALAARLRRD